MTKEATRALLMFIGILTLMFTYAYRGLFNSGMLSYGDLFAFPSQAVRWISDFTSAWSPLSLGVYESYSPGFFFHAILILLFGNNAILAQKFSFFSLLPVASLTMYIFLSRLISSQAGKFAVSLVYGINPLTIHEFWSGELGLLSAYAIFPLLLLFLFNLSEGRKQIRNILLFTLFFALASSFNINAILLFTPVLLAFLIRKNLRRVFIVASLFLASLALVLLLQLPYFLGEFTATGERLHPTAYMLEALTHELKDNFCSFTMINILGYFGFPLPIFAFLALLLVHTEPQRRYVINFSVVTILINLFLWATHNGWTWGLFRTFPILFAYRHQAKLMYSLSLLYYTLTAITVDELQKRLSRPLLGLINVSGIFRIIMLISLCTLIIPGVIAYDYRFLSGDMGLSNRVAHGDYAAKGIPPTFYRIGKWLDDRRRHEGFFRTLWLPLDFQTDQILKIIDPHTFMAPAGSLVKGYPTTHYIKFILHRTLEA